MRSTCTELMCVYAHGLLATALVHLREPVPGAFPDLEEVSHLGLHSESFDQKKKVISITDRLFLSLFLSAESWTVL